jgi:hypothetical protein
MNPFISANNIHYVHVTNLYILAFKTKDQRSHNARAIIMSNIFQNYGIRLMKILSTNITSDHYLYIT